MGEKKKKRLLESEIIRGEDQKKEGTLSNSRGGKNDRRKT